MIVNCDFSKLLEVNAYNAGVMGEKIFYKVIHLQKTREILSCPLGPY
jgi:hypothetical protein